MANIFDYMKWRGDLGLSQDKFNEIDNLILSRFSYLPFEDIIKTNEIITIKELNKRFKEQDINNIHFLWNNDDKLLPAMAKAKRFRNMKVTKYVNKINIEEEKQFSAITILMEDKTIYVSYRGTDDTLIGWKEDFNMSFKSHLESQKDAVKYLEEVAKEFPNKLRIGGHSKGGNFAVYASIFASDAVKNRIINIYNNDGPGFTEDITDLEEYKSIIKKVNTYIPQGSVFGKLLNHEETYKIVKSTEKGLMQHDLYSWQVLGRKFEYLKEITNGSKFIDKSIKTWLEQIDAKQRGEVIDIIFRIISETKVEKFPELKEAWFSNAKILFNSYRMLDAKDRKMVLETLSALIKIGKDNFVEEHPILKIKI